jgi:hypothetical protein
MPLIVSDTVRAMADPITMPINTDSGRMNCLAQ